MSQISSYPSISSGGTGPILTLSGNTGTNPVPPDGAGNIDVLGEGNIVVTGSAGTNTLTITDTGTSLVTATTIGATTSTLATIPVATGTAVFVEANVIATNVGANGALGGYVYATARNVIGTAVLVPFPEIVFQEDIPGTPTITATVSGSNLLIQVNGGLLQTIKWTGYVRVLTQVA